MNNILRAAHQYASLSLHIIPVCSGDHSGMSSNHLATCRSPGKQPLIKNWKKHGVPNSQQIDDWFRRWPTANIGLVMGVGSGLVALDIDGEFGGDTLIKISNGDNLSDAWQFSTPGGGMRYIFTAPKGRECRKFSIIDPNPNHAHSELAFLGDGSFSVLPPSKHTSGGIYTWINAPKFLFH
ncbi:bifunctional DNA primase/polymerase [Paenibacillus sp. FSL R10-2779]|uniref:bifunctional DNA primase/polymerase n=1 Tax=Paenibacillus sp. FSL R10-2779 TaxID=2975340 RepID=UPI0030FB03B2